MNTPSNPLQEAEQLAARIRAIIRGRNLPPEANINVLVDALVHEAVAFNRNDMENVLRAVRMTWLSIQAEQPPLGEGLDPVAKMNRLKILLETVVVGESLPLVVNVLVPARRHLERKLAYRVREHQDRNAEPTGLGPQRDLGSRRQADVVSAPRTPETTQEKGMNIHVRQYLRGRDDRAGGNRRYARAYAAPGIPR